MAKGTITPSAITVNNIQGLPDLVVGQASNLKLLFDKSDADQQDYINNTLIPELNGNNGSKKIGHSPTLITSDNVGDGLEEIQGNLNTVETEIYLDINTKDAQNVKLTGNQTVAGIKTFSSSPVVPTPTLQTQATNKDYVDTTIGEIVLGIIPDGTITDLKLSNTSGQIKQRFSNFEVQYEYQTPVILGNQIQVLKPSDSDIVKFKNPSLLTGAPITISTDGGLTSLPLVDIEANPVSELDAGFYEVIADATFFTLRPSGVLKINEQDIITGIAQGTIKKFDACYVDIVRDSITKLADPSTLPTGIGRGIAFSPDGIYLSVAHTTSPYITIYKRNGDVFTKLADPSTLPTGTGNGTEFSPDGTYLSVAHTTSPYITIYKRNGDVFTKLADPTTLPTANGNGTAFSPDGTYLSVAHTTSPYITIYKRSGDVFTKLADPSTLPTAQGNGTAFSPDGTYLSVAHGLSPYITIYKRIGDTFTKLANPTTLPTGTGLGTSISPDGAYLSVAHSTSPFITIYKRNGDVFTKLANPTTLPTGTGLGTSFSPDGAYLSVAHSTSPFITIYKRSGDVFTKLADPSTLPTDQGNGTAFSPDGAYLSVAHSTSPYITIYKNAYIYLTYKSTSIDNLIGRYGAGYSKQNASLGSNVEVVRIFR